MRPHTGIRKLVKFLQVFTLLSIAGACAAHAAHRVQRAPETGCGFEPEDAPSTYCSPLIPTPDLRDVRATLELRPIATPFGTALTADGRARNRLNLLIEGLPSARTLGDYNEYVAWATDLTLGEFVRLGAVRNGRNELGELAANQYRVLVTAERAADGERRAGRIVLRGTSPSVRLLGHRDVLLSAGDAFGQPLAASGGHAHGAAAANEWVTPPMETNMPAMPGMHGRQPTVTPFAPGAGGDPATIPFVRPRSLHRLRSGDTLELTARPVRRRIGAAQEARPERIRSSSFATEKSRRWGPHPACASRPGRVLSISRATRSSPASSACTTTCTIRPCSAP